jgi:hypothetical protein
MGFEINSTNLLLYALKSHPDLSKIKNVLTLGRQNILELPKSSKYTYKNMEYAENYLQFLMPNANIESIDVSKYEGATYECDLGENLSNELHQSLASKFDLVIDFGTTDHIYNFPMALLNSSTFLNKNGVIIHALCANNWINHGFYQISPDLFYSLYSEKNGYSNTQVFLSINKKNKYFYRVNKTIGGKRATAESASETYVVAISTLGSNGFSHSKIYQTDWLPKWSPDALVIGGVKLNNIKKYKKLLAARFPYIRSLYVKLYESTYWHTLKLFRLEKINRINPNLQRIKVKTLLS